jgi:hypothetical protein
MQEIRHLLRKTNPSSGSRGYAVSKYISGLGKNKMWAWVQTRLETMNDCPGEARQRFTGLDKE